MSQNATEWVYGIAPVEQCLIQQKRKFKQLYLKEGGRPSPRVQSILELAKQAGVSVRWVPKQQLQKWFPQDNHQGVALHASPLPTEGPDFLKSHPLDPTPVFLALDQVEDPHNIGAIIRSCGFFGASGLIVAKPHFPGITSTVVKTSTGVSEQLPIIVVPNLVRFLNQHKENYWVVGMDGQAKDDLPRLKRDRPLIMVLGNEGKGLGNLVRNNCDWLVKIPGGDQVESLNVSNAASILLYQLAPRD